MDLLSIHNSKGEVLKTYFYKKYNKKRDCLSDSLFAPNGTTDTN